MTVPRYLPLLAMLPSALLAQRSSAQSGPGPSTSVTLPAGTQLPVSIPTKLPMKAGEPISAQLLYPVYIDDHLVLPVQTVVTGTVVSLTPDHSHRVKARLQADFTPFYTPVVRFDHIRLADGSSVPITTGTATDGAPIYRLLAPPPRKGGFFARHYTEAREFALDRIHLITAPGKADRLQQLFYSQLPYHPQRIEKETAWTVETDGPVTFTPALFAASTIKPASQSASASDPELPPAWIVQGYLTTPISSASSRPGDPISATVAEHVLNSDGSVAVPQGSLLTGTVTQARPARRFARAGELRFNFRQLTLPGGEPQSVRASLRGADSASAGQLAMDSEGQVKTKPQDKILVPLILLQLASRPLDRDHGNHDQFGKDLVGSNSLGFIGFIIGTAARRPNLSAAIGYYGAALSIYDRIFSRGKEVAFAKDTRIVIQTTAARSAALKPVSPPEPAR